MHVVKTKMKGMLPIGCGLGDSRGAVSQSITVSEYENLSADLLEVLAALCVESTR